MTAPTRLLGQFDVRHAPALRALAATMRRKVDPGPALTIRQAVVVSAEATTPPTCTISFDGTVNISGIRYLAGYTPAAGKVVEVFIRNGNTFVGGLA